MVVIDGVVAGGSVLRGCLVGVGFWLGVRSAELLVFGVFGVVGLVVFGGVWCVRCLVCCCCSVFSVRVCECVLLCFMRLGSNVG